MAPDEYKARRQRILDWQRLHPLPSEGATHQIKEYARKKAAEVIAAFDAAVADVRRLKQGAKQ